MQLVVITPENDVPREPQLINELFDAGMKRLHVRKPSFSIDTFRCYISSINQQYHSRIIITQHFELLNEFNLGGVHLNSHLRTKQDISKFFELRPKLSVSASFHSWAELFENYIPYHYVFISPVFDSLSKTGYKAAIDLNGANELKEYFAIQKKYCPQIIALGGVKVEKVEILHQYGFDGAALLGAVWLSNDPVTAFINVRDTIVRLPPLSRSQD